MGHFHHLIFVTELLLVSPVGHMDPHETEWSLNLAKCPELVNYQLKCDALTYRVIFNTLYCMWWSDTGISEELVKEGWSFRNNADVSMLFSQHLNWNLLAVFPELSNFNFGHNSHTHTHTHTKKTKTRLLRLSKLWNSQLIPLKMTY